MKIALLAFAVAGLLVASVESQCTNDSVRLIWGLGPWEGNVQLCINGVWSWVCHNNFGNVDAQVVCTQLGFTAAGSAYRMWSYFGEGDIATPIVLDYVDCAGTESRLVDCPSLYPIGVTTSACTLVRLAGVVCPNGGGSCSNGDIRLLNNAGGVPNRGQGRVEVCKNSQWGTICDDYWGTSDAKVACYQLGYTKNGAVRYINAAFGQGYGPIHLDNMYCSSAESSLFDCNNGGSISSNCGHDDDAGVRCNGLVSTSCTNGAVMLWRPGGVGPEYYGLGLYCKNNAWTGVCDDSFTCHTGRIICQSLGFAGMISYRSELFWGYYNSIDHYAFSCSGSHSSLSQCSYYYHSNCYSLHDQIGFACYPNVQGTTCTDGDVRLANGTTAFNGRVEYCFEGEWAALCSLTTTTASLICKQLGFNSTYAIIYSDERYGILNVKSGINYVNCSNTATSLSQCNNVLKGSGTCFLAIRVCGTEMSLQCFNNTGACVDGSVRLVNGTIQQEGRVEVCSQGLWGSVCPYTWGSIDAYIVCKQLGYTGTSPLSYFNSYFGGGEGPGIFGSVQCYGWEDSIFECNKVTFPGATCNPLTSNIGVVCKEGCNNGDVRLLGGGFENEGTVQVCYGNLWGLVSDNIWNDNNARVVCNQLGYTGGIAMSVSGSYYGKPNNTIHLKSVTCTGSELTIDDCTKTQLSVDNGKLELPITEVAGVDCIYDVPTEPPCVQRPSIFDTTGDFCDSGNVQLAGGQQQSGYGRLEYCLNGYWSPFCKLDPVAASVACKQLGYTQYSWASIIESGEFGTGRNFSLFDNITCTGTENSLTQCIKNINTACTPWCRLANIGLRCFNPSPPICNNGAIRLADGIIENEGRVELCVNNVWGTICSQGWDETDAHIICTQLGHPELKPIIFNSSEFGSGLYPIVYTSSGCGGYESTYADCVKQVYPLSTCSRNNVAGVLCGYDCQDGDVRLSGSQWSYEGTVQICYKNLWGLVSDSGWTQADTEVVCRQLGYEPSGSLSVSGSQYGKPNLTLHYSSVDCTGLESTVTDCTYSTLSLQDGKNMLKQTNVAGVKCYTPDQCVTPPTGGSDCTNGLLRLKGGQAGIPEGTLEYCYKGLWSPFCYLGPNEATVACRQLGYANYELAVVFNDGRFTNTSSTSFFQNISCTDSSTTTSFSQCTLMDTCQSNCNKNVGLRCYETANCAEGDVRLVGGSFDTEGRVEVCHNNIWGTICGTGFTAIDAYVVCKELGLGTSEPTVYTNSYFGDGDASIIFSEVDCKGYEQTIANCPRKDYGSFTCSRDNIVGIICQDQCKDGDIQLVDGSTTMEGTILICNDNTWGLIADAGWNDNNAQVVCKGLGYSRGGMAVLGSQYSKPNKTILLNNVDCTGSETSLDNCSSIIVDPENGRNLYNQVNVAGVKCLENLPTKDPLANAVSSTQAYIGIGIVLVLLVVSILLTISLILYVVVKRQKVKKAIIMYEPRVQISGLGTTGYENPMTDLENDETVDFDTAERNELVKELSKQ